MQLHKQKINLLFVLLQLNAGGSERVALELARNIDDSRYNVYVASFSGGSLEGSFGRVCKDIYFVPKGKGFDFNAMIEIGRIVHACNIAVVNAHHYMCYFYSYPSSKLINRRCLIYTEHSVAEVESICGIQRHLCDLMMLDTDAFVGVSNEIGESFKRRFPVHSDRIVSIPNGVDLRRFATELDRDQVRSEWGLFPEHFVIGCVANFRKVKNHPCLIRAFYRLKEVCPYVRLMLVGKGYAGDTQNSEEEIRDLVKSYGLLDSVIFAGYQEDIPRIIQTFDICCLTSFSEGLPVSILEAMASKVPVVGSDVKGIGEVIYPFETGLLFPSDDDEILARLLRQLIEDHSLRQSIATRAFSFVAKNHGLDEWVSKYEKLFFGFR